MTPRRAYCGDGGSLLEYEVARHGLVTESAGARLRSAIRPDNGPPR